LCAEGYQRNSVCERDEECIEHELWMLKEEDKDRIDRIDMPLARQFVGLLRIRIIFTWIVAILGEAVCEGCLHLMIPLRLTVELWRQNSTGPWRLS
jgi:hypothetical protein